MTINAKKIDLEKVPPSNLVFLIDASGSMDMPNRLPVVKAAFQMLVKNLRPIDTVSIVTYGGSVSVWLEPTGGDDKQKILKAIEELTAGGDTPGENGIKTAYKVAEKAFIKGGNNRVILATDGDFNVGETTEKSLEDLVSKERQSGVFLTCLGVGTGNFKDSKLQSMAKRGNGNYAYLDDIKEAEKVLVTEMTQTFYSVAGDVFLNVTFNPAVVGEYRLIGFDNKKDAFTDSTGQLEGGEVGSGNSVLALFEITPTASGQIIGANNNLAEVSLRYTPIEQKEEKLFLYKCPNTTIPFDSLKKDLRFATSIAMFGQKLRASKYIPATINWSNIKKIAINAHDPNNFLEGDFIQLLDLSQKIYGNKRVKRRKSEDDN
jgi:Ca-activated chloride channel family protein